MLFQMLTLPWSFELIQHFFQSRTVVLLQTPVILALLFQNGVFPGKVAILIIEPVVLLL